MIAYPRTPTDTRLEKVVSTKQKRESMKGPTNDGTGGQTQAANHQTIKPSNHRPARMMSVACRENEPKPKGRRRLQEERGFCIVKLKKARTLSSLLCSALPYHTCRPKYTRHMANYLFGIRFPRFDFSDEEPSSAQCIANNK